MPTDIREANAAWEALLTAHTVLMRRFAEESIWKDHGISMREYDVLYTLAKHGGRAADRGDEQACAARIGDLQSGVLLSQPALSRMVDRLAARGLVERVEDEHDGRAVRVRLTAAGLELQRAVGRAHARSVAREIGEVLDTGEQRILQQLATRLVAGPADNRGAEDGTADGTATSGTAVSVTTDSTSTDSSAAASAADTP